MGEVWLGHHSAQQVPVAVKVIGGQLAHSEHFHQAFRTEVQAVARLSHPNIIMVFDYGLITEEAEEAAQGRLVAGSPFFAMEVASGGSLDDIPPPQSWSELRVILTELLDALAHAHAHGVIHRDIKPGNVLVCTDADPRPGIKLTDFGLAAAGERLKAERLTGTPAFMAPEQCDGNWRDHGPWTDLYGLGCLAYALASGHPPFDDTNPMQVVVQQLSVEAPSLTPLFELPDGFEPWVQRLMAKDPRDRFQRAADASSVLRKLKLGNTFSPSALSRPLVPMNWRDPKHQTAPTSMRLVGVGLGLYDLRPVPMVHRESERDHIWSRLNDVALSSRARLLLLRGDPGVGKSRLISWLCQRAHELGAATPLRAFHSSTVASPNEGLVRMLATQLRCIGLERIDVLLRIKSIFQTQGVREDYEWNAFTELLSPAFPDEEGDVRVRFSNPQERYTLIRRYLERLAQERPVILALEDVQWGFHALDFVEHLLSAQSRHPNPILIVMTAREDALAQQPSESARLREIMALDNTESLEVATLDASARSALVRELLGLEGPLAAQVEERCGGNPLFAVQLVGDWVSRGVLEVGDTGFVLKSGERAVIPDTIHELWVTRLSQVLEGLPDPEAATHCLEIAAALGSDVNTGEWRDTASVEQLNVPRGLVDNLIESGLAHASEDGFFFAHGMFRESLERAASEALRWQKHNRACATMIEARSGEHMPHGVAERIGRHLLAAGALEKAVDWLLIGAREREDTSDFRVVHVLLERRDRALTQLRIPESDPRWGEGWVIRAQASHVQGNTQEALEWAEKAVEGARAHGWEQVLPRALRRLAHPAQNMNQHDKAEQALREALALYQQSESQDWGEARTLRSLGTLMFLRGRFDESKLYLERALELGDALEADRLVADSLYALADVSRKRGELDQTERYIQRASRIYERSGNQLGVSITVGALADVHRYLGKYDEAEVGYRRAVEVNESIGGYMGVIYQLNLGLLLLQRKRYEEAETLLLETRDALVERRWRYLLGVVDVALLPCLAKRAAWDAWDERFEQGTSMLQQGSFYDPDVAWPAELAGDVCAELGELTRAQSAWRFALEQWEALGDKEHLKQVQTKL